jgi:small GTP-binding protein
VDPDQVATKFELWDTAGQERYRALAPMYYRGARAVLLCFSIDSRESVLSLINNFLPEVVKAYGANPKASKSAERPVMYLLGLKSDREIARQVSTNEAKIIARALKLKYFECSAKLGQNVNEIMEQMKDDVLKTLRISEPKQPVTPPTEARRWCSIQ